MTIQRLNDLPKGESVTMLYYGGSGTGKTEFCGTAGSDCGIINSGLGLVTLQSPGFKKRHPNVNPIIVTISEEAIPDNAKAFDLTCDTMDEFLENPEIKTIILDDVTALRRFAMNKGLEINQAEAKSQSLAKSKARKVIMKAVQDYGIEMDLIEQFIVTYTGMCKSHNKHLIITAHERIQYTKPLNASGSPIIGAPPIVDKIRPGFTGQTFPDSVTGHFDFIWYAETLGKGSLIKYQAVTMGGDKLVAKTRWSGLFDPTVMNPNFLDIVKKVREVK